MNSYNLNINFMGKKNIAAIISSILIIVGIISLIIYGPKRSIDFTGGSIIQVQFNEEIDISTIRSSLVGGNLEGSEISVIKDNSGNIEYRIKAPSFEKGSDINAVLSESLGNYKYEIRKIDKVGPIIGKELAQQAIWAIICALTFILVYISIRFDSFFAFGSVIALLHDILITLGIFSIFRMEIDLSVVAAFLTIVGYSLNDTIVIFDRIRENLEDKESDLELEDKVNKSINESLSRTVITSLTTMMVVVTLFIFGGEVIRMFSVAMIIGVFIGTYSSIYIASPSMMLFKIYFGTDDNIEEE